LRAVARFLALTLAAFLLLAPDVAAAQDKPASAADLRLMVIGDSLTAGFGLPSKEAFPSQLEAALRAEGLAVTVLNAGVSGDTSAGGRARLDWALADKPDAVMIELGANDGLRGIEPKTTYDNLATMIRTLKSRSIPVFLAGMYAPPNLGAAYGKEFRGVYTRLAEEFGIPLQEFFLEGVAAQAKLNQADGIHPNAAGVAVIVQNLKPKLVSWLANIHR
jgi:acyl-CoA thioesterase-1